MFQSQSLTPLRYTNQTSQYGSLLLKILLQKYVSWSQKWFIVPVQVPQHTGDVVVIRDHESSSIHFLSAHKSSILYPALHIYSHFSAVLDATKVLGVLAVNHWSSPGISIAFVGIIQLQLVLYLFLSALQVMSFSPMGDLQVQNISYSGFGNFGKFQFVKAQAINWSEEPSQNFPSCLQFFSHASWVLAFDPHFEREAFSLQVSSHPAERLFTFPAPFTLIQAQVHLPSWKIAPAFSIEQLSFPTLIAPFTVSLIEGSWVVSVPTTTPWSAWTIKVCSLFAVSGFFVALKAKIPPLEFDIVIFEPIASAFLLLILIFPPAYAAL